MVTTQAVYENGVLRPLQPLAFGEGQVVWLRVGERIDDEPYLDTEYIAECAAEAGEDVSLEEVRRILAKIPGSMVEDFRAERDERF